MPRQVTAEKVDELDGSAGDVVTVRFALDGVRYEIDLNGEHAQELRSLLAPHAAAARRVTRSSIAARRSLSRAMREWANRSGYYVSPMGTIPCDVQHAFRIRRPLPPAPAIEPLDLDLFVA